MTAVTKEELYNADARRRVLRLQLHGHHLLSRYRRAVDEGNELQAQHMEHEVDRLLVQLTDLELDLFDSPIMAGDPTPWQRFVSWLLRL